MMTMCRAISLFGKQACSPAVRKGVLDLALLSILFAAAIGCAHTQTGSTGPGAAGASYPDMPQIAPIGVRIAKYMDGYEVTMVKDATADYSDEEMHAALDVNMPNYASAVVTTNEVVDSISSL